MQSKQGRTLPFLGLSEGHINKSSGTFLGATTFKCVTDGLLIFKYNSADSTRAESQAFLVGDQFCIANCQSITISSGTFHIGFD